MTQAIIGRWGKSIAVELPNEIASRLHLHEGETVDIDAGPDAIVIRRARPTYDIDKLFAGRSAEEWRSLYAAAYDWGPDVGREVVEE